MLGDRRSFLALHGRWCGSACAVTILAAGTYAWLARGAERWPGGGSGIGLIFGTLAGLIILFEFALWPRRSRRFRTARWLGSAEAWMKAHLWLGLLSLPLFYLHCGFRFGGAYTSLLAWCFLAVIGSGVLGWIAQTWVPRWLWEQVPRETVFGEIEQVAAQYATDAARIVQLTCGDGETANPSTGPRGERSPRDRDANDTQLGEPPEERLRAGAARRVGTRIDRDPAGRVEYPPVARCGALRQAYERDLRDYMTRGATTDTRLAGRASQQTYFAALRALVPAEAHPAVSALADLCESRRQLDEQRRWHWILHGWLCLHLPLSATLVILLIAHVFFALRYG